MERDLLNELRDYSSHLEENSIVERNEIKERKKGRQTDRQTDE